MTLKEYAQENLVSAVPADVRVWHWTGRPGAVSVIAQRITDGADCSDMGQGALGPGLYVSTSPVDLMDPGQNVLAAVLRSGTRVLMVDPLLFQVGTPEILDVTLARLRWPFRFPRFHGKVDPEHAVPPNEVVPALLRQLDLPAAAYIYGLHLAFVVRSGACLQFDPEIDAVELVAEYAKQNPHDRPMLLPANAVEQWLARQGRRPR